MYQELRNEGMRWNQKKKLPDTSHLVTLTVYVRLIQTTLRSVCIHNISRSDYGEFPRCQIPRRINLELKNLLHTIWFGTYLKNNVFHKMITRCNNSIYPIPNLKKTLKFVFAFNHYNLRFNVYHRCRNRF